MKGNEAGTEAVGRTVRQGKAMEIFDSGKDLRVVVRTPAGGVVDMRVTQLEVEDQLGRFVIKADGEPALAALVPANLVLRKRDGSETHIAAGFGTLIAVGHEARIVVHEAKVLRGKRTRRNSETQLVAVVEVDAEDVPLAG
jgi:F0F1-type ATP synthase epsilon subunit